MTAVPDDRADAKRLLVWAFALALLALALYLPALRCGFVRLDDPNYVTNNPHVLGGLSIENIRWAFSTQSMRQDFMYIPLTWLSLMLDTTLWGREAWGYHLTNILLHAFNTALLMLALGRATRRIGLSTWVAALFAAHPLHVESVVWVTERKDVLFACFSLLALNAHIAYAGAKADDKRSCAATFAWFAMSLLAKPMAVTLPVVLLAFDWWPLRRRPSFENGASPIRRLKGILGHPVVVEKIPFFALAMLYGWITVSAQASGMALSGNQPLAFRAGYTLYSLGWYLAKFVWPWPLYVASFSDRIAYFPLKILLSAFALLGLSLWTWRGRTAAPARWFGWIFFLVTIAPVSGWMQTGSMGVADRFMYWPMVGLLVVAVWSFAGASGFMRRVGLALGGVALAACCALTLFQIGVWRDSGSLFRHALAHGTRNYLVHTSYGNHLVSEGETEEGLKHLRRAADLIPDHPKFLHNLGHGLMEAGRYAEARAVFARAARRLPSQTPTLNKLTLLAIGRGDWTEARERIATIRALQPVDADQLEALLRERMSVTAKLLGGGATPVSPAGLNAQGERLMTDGRWREAEALYRVAVELTPYDATTLNNRAWLLAVASDPAVRDPRAAVRLAQQAVAAGGRGDANVLSTLAAAQVAAGDEAAARATLDLAIPLARDAQQREALNRRKAALEEAGGR